MSQQRKILFMDNVKEDMEPLSELLELEGYQVLKASTIAEAKQRLKDEWVHMMIVDLNMRGGDDDDDRSGLEIVNNPDYVAVSKIILTGYADDAKVLRQMIPTSDGRRLVIGFLGKNDGGTHRAIIELFNTLPINWDLQILWNPKSLRSLISLAGLVIPDKDRIFLPHRVDELEDLFRKLFLNSQQMIVGRLFTCQMGVVWIEIFTQEKNDVTKQFVVACGQKQQVKRQRDQYQLIPHNNTIRYIETAETLRFAATLYEYPVGNLAELVSLQDLYLRCPSRVTEDIVYYLFNLTLSAWHRQRSSLREIENIRELYQAWPQKQETYLDPEDWAINIEDLCNKAPTAGGLFRIGYSPEQLTLYISTETVSYSNPLHFLLMEGALLNTPFLYGTVHGNLHPGNILVDPQKHAWLIDFSQIQESPVLLDFVALEVAFKAELLNMVSMEMMYIIEKRLLAVNGLTDLMIMDDLDPEIQKILRMIGVIRGRAAIAVNQSLRSYLAGLFVHLITQVAIYDKKKPCMGHELAVYLYYLISAAVISQHLTSPREFVPNFEDKFVRVEGQKKSGLTKLEWQLLEYLYDNAGHLCTSEDILKEVYQDSSDDIENGAWVKGFGKPKVNAAIGRLRKKLEPNPEKPRYILTEWEHGYKLEI